MTTAEALAVVREALPSMEGHEPNCPCSVGRAHAALALIEQEMERLFRENNRLGEALAYERNEIAPAERRVAELEAALREIVDMDYRGNRSPEQDIARRALGGGEA